MKISELLKNAEVIDAIDSETGEVFEDSVVIPISRIQKEEELERIRKANYKDKQICKYYKRETDNKFGNFIGIYFNISTILEENLSPCDLFRLIYLATFVNYNGQLMKTERTPLCKYKELQDICSLKSGLWFKTYEKFVNNYLYPSDNKIEMNNMFVKKGNLKLHPSKDTFKFFRCISIKNMRCFYRSLKTIQHDRAGKIFKLLPYINRCNMFCFNPLEKDFNEIMPLSESDFCELLGLSIDKSNINRFMKCLYDFKLDNSHPLIKKVWNKELNKEVILINPLLVKIIDEEKTFEIVRCFGYE